jgi:hypothetical protein
MKIKDEPISRVIPCLVLIAFDGHKYGKASLCHMRRVTLVGIMWLPIKKNKCWLLRLFDACLLYAGSYYLHGTEIARKRPRQSGIQLELP